MNVQAIELFLNSLSNNYGALSVQFPDTDTYWNSVISGEARTEYRKAAKQSYDLVDLQEVPLKAVLNIYGSSLERQGRPINWMYTDIDFAHHDVRKGWPIKRYDDGDGSHYFKFYGVRKGTKLVAFAEIIRCGSIMNIHMTMAHSAEQKHGVMKWLFLELVRISPWCRELVYGDTGFLNDDRKYFLDDLGIAKPFRYSLTKHQTIVIDVDDLEIMRSDSGLDLFVKLKENYPNLKVTFFMIPMAQALLKKDVTFAQYKEWATWLREQEWIEICPHGFMHAGLEMYEYPTAQGKMKPVDYATAVSYIEAAEKMFAELELPYKKIWKSPRWATSEEAMRAIWDKGYVLASDAYQDRPTGGPIYLFNWSIDQPFPTNLTLVKGHGHLYAPNVNDIHDCMHNMLQMPEDAEFKFVSEVL